MNPNLAEILVANGTGAVLVVMLYLSRRTYYKRKTIGGKMFDFMLLITWVANIAEIISFLIDGKDFPFCRGLLLAVNAICVGATVTTGFCWCLYTDFRIHRNRQSVRKTAARLGLPFVVILLMLLADLFGAKLLFEITPENVYVRGKLSPLVYLLLFAYYTYSVVITYRFWKKAPYVRFFPVLYFILPCMVGTVVQGLFYGITIGWLTVAIAFVFVQLHFQSESAFIDNLSGLYNRNYFIHVFEVLQRKSNNRTYGIMMDINGFKKINDTFGHIVGDDVIRTIGAILQESTPDNSVALRMGGDEFVVLLMDGTQEQTDGVIQQIQNRVAQCNESREKSYTLSLSIGSACYHGGDTDVFLSDMDKELYACKQRYYGSIQ